MHLTSSAAYLTTAVYHLISAVMVTVNAVYVPMRLLVQILLDPLDILTILHNIPPTPLQLQVLGDGQLHFCFPIP